MKAIVLKEPELFERVDIEEPGDPGPGDAVVCVHRVGICGTDISGYLGKMPFFSYPRIPGHELGVEVVAVGDGVTNVQVGDRCSVEPYVDCQQCYACRRGNSNCCENLRVFGVHADGGLRRLFIVPARKLHKSEKLAMEQLALVETLGIGCHCIDRADPEPGDHLLVIGAGPIGLSVIEFAKLAEAKVIVLDMNQQRLDFCKETMSVDHIIRFIGDGTEVDRLREITDGAMPRLVVDATGSSESMSGAVNYVAHTGKVIFVGITTEEISFPHPKMHLREMSLLSSRNALPTDFGRIIQLIEEGRINTQPWITHRTGFDDMIGDFPSFIKPETGVIKAIVEVD